MTACVLMFNGRSRALNCGTNSEKDNVVKMLTAEFTISPWLFLGTHPKLGMSLMGLWA